MAEKRAFERLTDNIWELMKSLEVREPENGLFHRSLKRALNRTRWTNADVAVFDRFCKQVRWYAESPLPAPKKERREHEILQYPDPPPGGIPRDRKGQDRPLYLRPDRLRLPAYRQLPLLRVRGPGQALLPVSRATGSAM